MSKKGGKATRSIERQRSYSDELLTASKEKLLELVESGNFNAIKFVIESLDPAFSIEAKDLLVRVYKAVMSAIEQATYLSSEQKMSLGTTITTLFENYENFTQK